MSKKFHKLEKRNTLYMHGHERNRIHAVRSLCVLNRLQSPFAALSDHRRWFRIDVPAREHCDQNCDMLKDPLVSSTSRFSRWSLLIMIRERFLWFDYHWEIISFLQIFLHSEFVIFFRDSYLAIIVRLQIMRIKCLNNDRYCESSGYIILYYILKILREKEREEILYPHNIQKFLIISYNIRRLFF